MGEGHVHLNGAHRPTSNSIPYSKKSRICQFAAGKNSVTFAKDTNYRPIGATRVSKVQGVELMLILNFGKYRP